MGLLEDINSGNYNLVIIIIGFFFIFHLYWKKSNTEQMTDTNNTNTNITDQIKEAVKQYYIADVESIRNLSEVATKLQAGGLAVPGNLIMKGPIITDHDIAHPDTKDGAVYRAEGQLTVASDDLIRFRSSTKKANTIEMNVNDGSINTTGPVNSNGIITSKGNVINGDLIVNGRIIANGGGDFSGGRYFFTDEEKCGRLRVGCAWGKPGIYAEDGKELVIGSSAGTISLNNAENLTGNNNFVRYDDTIAITNRGTGNHEGNGTYLGLCGGGGCGKVSVNLHPENEKDRAKFKIIRF